MCTLKDWWKLSFRLLIVTLITSMCNTKYLEERILILSSLAQKLQFKPAEEVKFNILVNSVVSSDATQRNVMVFGFLVPIAFQGMQHE